MSLLFRSSLLRASRHLTPSSLPPLSSSLSPSSSPLLPSQSPHPTFSRSFSRWSPLSPSSSLFSSPSSQPPFSPSYFSSSPLCCEKPPPPRYKLDKKKYLDQDKEKESGKNSEDPMKNHNRRTNVIIASLVMGYLLLNRGSSEPSTPISFSTFVTEFLPNANALGITKIGIHGSTATFRTKTKAYSMTVNSREVFESQLEHAQHELGIPYHKFLDVYYWEPSFQGIEIIFLLGLIGFQLYKKRGDLKAFFEKALPKPPVKSYAPEQMTNNNARFKDIAGLEEAKLEIMEYVSFLQDPKSFTRLGASTPHGALLVGPPGTGKTLLAKATAAEAGVPFFSTAGSDFVEMYSGMGALRIRSLFEAARKNAPCLLFIDEIDAIGRKRTASGGSGERENTLNQLLVEMDGFNSETGVVVLAGTNLPESLDPALLRAGRFDRRINIDKPDIKSRQHIFQVYLEKIHLSRDLNQETVAERMAALTAGLTGADIANITNEAALRAARMDKEGVDLEDLEVSVERSIVGLQKNMVLSHEEKKTVAFHEAGHAILGWFLEHTQPLMKLSIIPRGNGALGYAQYLPKDQFLYTKAQIDDIACMALGGRIAEEIKFDRITTGARDDLDRVTKMLYAQSTKYGMGETVGPLSFRQARGERMSASTYSEATAEGIDEEVRNESFRLYERGKKILLEKREQLEVLGEELLRKEVLNRQEVAELLGPRPYEKQDLALEMFDSVTKKMEEEKKEKEEREKEVKMKEEVKEEEKEEVKEEGKEEGKEEVKEEKEEKNEKEEK